MYHQLLFGATCAGILLAAGLLPLPERDTLPDLSLPKLDMSELDLPEASAVIAGIGKVVSDLPEMGATIQETVIAPSIERLRTATRAAEPETAAPEDAVSRVATAVPATMASAPSVAIEAITFDLDTFELDVAAKAQLDRFARQMAARPSAKLGIYGHTDLTGAEAYNTVLGRSRAEQVAAYLTDQGIESDRIVVIKSYGESAPTVPTDEPSRINRRVIIEIL